MKRVTAIVMIAVMSVQCFYKLGVITYFQLNREYIAEFLCINKEEPITMCYGQCFLKKNLDITDDSSPAATNTAQGKERVDFPVFLISQITCAFNGPLSRPIISGLYFFSVSSKHATIPFHPPTVG